MASSDLYDQTYILYMAFYVFEYTHIFFWLVKLTF